MHEENAIFPERWLKNFRNKELSEIRTVLLQNHKSFLFVEQKMSKMQFLVTE